MMAETDGLMTNTPLPPPLAPVAAPKPQPSMIARALDFYWGNYLPLMMIFVVFFGYLVPGPGSELDKPKIELCGANDTDCEFGKIKVTSSACVFCIFLLSGLGLKTDDVQKALVQWKAILYSFVSINFMTGCAAFLLVALPFEPKELAVGLAVFCSMPTTLSSGAVLVDQVLLPRPHRRRRRLLGV
jgi:sodium/bile acid cotransporter 7